MLAQPWPNNDLLIADDDASMRDALFAEFTTAGYRVTLFGDADRFLAAAPGTMPAAVLIDLHLAGKSGMDVLRELDAVNFPAPIFMMSGDGEVARAVEAMRCGAFDYVVKPFDPRALVMRVGGAVASFARPQVYQDCDIASGYPGQLLLTPREREVLAQIAGGASNKEAGRRLAISPRTIEVHRSRIMEKIGARNAADLVRIVLGGGSRSRGVSYSAASAVMMAP